MPHIIVTEKLVYKDGLNYTHLYMYIYIAILYVPI